MCTHLFILRAYYLYSSRSRLPGVPRMTPAASMSTCVPRVMLNLQSEPVNVGWWPGHYTGDSGISVGVALSRTSRPKFVIFILSQLINCAESSWASLSP